MRMGKMKRYVQAWAKKGLISEEQAGAIFEYMRLQRRQHMLRLIKVLFVLGGFWLVMGVVATLKLIDVRIFVSLWNFICRIFSPVVSFAQWVAGERYDIFLIGLGCTLGWGIFHYLGRRLQERSTAQMVKLGFLADNDLRLGTTSLTIGYILASIAFQTFNYLMYPLNTEYCWSQEVLIPYFSFLAIAFFLYAAYRMKDQIALLFGIGFLSHAIGFFSAYFFSCYVIGVRFPVIQSLVGALLVFIGLWHVEKVRSREDHYFFMFGRTYQSLGLLFVYISLWIMSIWGITYQESYWNQSPAAELWFTNILFLAASLGGMLFGAFKEDRMYFNYGLTFFIIDTYTLFFSHVWSTVGSAVGSLFLGILLVSTGYFLRRLILQKKIA